MADVDGKPLRVLVVDDDAEMRALLRRTLEQAGYAVVEARHGDDAVAALRAHPIHTMILDKEMPGRGGFEVLPLLRVTAPTLPIIVVTAFGGRDVERKALALGATRYLEKPFRLAKLLELMEEVR